MTITATELKENLGKYLELSRTEDIFVTKNGRLITKLTNPYAEKTEILKSLAGCIKTDMTIQEARGERLDEKCAF